jgi:hypothetical protein
MPGPAKALIQRDDFSVNAFRAATSQQSPIQK